MADGVAAMLTGAMSDRAFITGFLVALGVAALLFVAWGFGFFSTVVHLQGA